MKKIDEMVSSLCEEIDILRDDSEYWKQQYEDLKVKYDASVMTSIRQSKAVGLGMVAIATNDKDLAESVSKWNMD
jgi:hypothetical protein